MNIKEAIEKKRAEGKFAIRRAQWLNGDSIMPLYDDGFISLKLSAGEHFVVDGHKYEIGPDELVEDDWEVV